MKFDIKTSLILILLLLTGILGFKWFFGGDDASKEKIKQLDEKFRVLEADKGAADAKIIHWQKKFSESDTRDKKLQSEINRLKIEARIAEERAKKSKADLDKVQSSIANGREEIEDLKKNPPVLTDDELLEALIEKTN
jgi:chromosome segregation ATPase